MPIDYGLDKLSTDELLGASKTPAAPSAPPAPSSAPVTDYGLDKLPANELLGAPVDFAAESAKAAALFEASFGNQSEEVQKRKLATDIERITGAYTAPGVLDVREATRQHAQLQADHATRASPRTSEFLSVPENAAVAMQDAKTMANIEKIVGGDPLRSLEIVAKRLAMSPANLGAWGFDVAAVVPDILGETASAAGLAPQYNIFRDMASGSRRNAVAARNAIDYLTPEARNMVERAAASAGTSAGTSLQLLPLAMSGAGAPMAAAFGIGTFGESYTRAREEGKSPLQALQFAIPQGAFEGLFEMMPAAFLADALKKAPPMKEFFLGLAAREVPTELMTTLSQNLNEWVTFNPGKSAADFIAEQPEALAETAIATIMGAGLQAGILHGVQRATGQFQQKAEERRTQQLQETLTGLMDQAKQIKADPVTFQNFMAGVTDNASVFINADALRDTLAQNKMDVSVLPSLAEQLAQPSVTGDVEVPIGELMTAFAGTPAQEQIVQHARVRQDDLSAAEQAKFGDMGAFFKQQGEAVMEKQKENEAFVSERKEIEADIVKQLGAASPFQEREHRYYAQMMGAFYSTAADLMGSTPKQIQARWAPKISGPNGAATTGPTLTQGFDHGQAMLNVGFDVGATDRAQKIDADFVKAEIEKMGVQVLSAEQVEGEYEYEGKPVKELTYVPHLSRPLTEAEVNQLAIATGQEAIGHYAGGTGNLWGPNAAAWGDFNPEFFKDQRGVKLSDAQKALEQPSQKYKAVDVWSKTFQAWFGKSKVVDDRGRPLQVFHGTASDVGAFDPAKAGANYPSTGGQEGLYFTDDSAIANVYAEQAGYKEDGGENVVPVYLSLQNPVERKTSGSPDKYFDYNRDKILAAAKKAGADGVIVRGGDRTLYVAFKSEQVKSAISNTGRFQGPNVLEQSARRGTGVEPGAGERAAAGVSGSELAQLNRSVGAVAGPVVGIHFSQQERPTLSSSAWGTGLKGAEGDYVRAAKDKRLRHRITFYVNTGNGIHPESGVGGTAHAVTLRNLYDADADVLKIWRNNPDERARESAVLDAGFDGFLTRNFGKQGAVVLLGERAVEVEHLGSFAASAWEIPKALQTAAIAAGNAVNTGRHINDLQSGFDAASPKARAATLAEILNGLGKPHDAKTVAGYLEGRTGREALAAVLADQDARKTVAARAEVVPSPEIPRMKQAAMAIMQNRALPNGQQSVASWERDLERSDPDTAALIAWDKIPAGDYYKDQIAGQLWQTTFKPVDTESAEFKKWAHSNRLVSVDDSQAEFFKAGEAVVVEALHGTTGDVTAFDLSKASVESDLGAGIYATNTPEDVSENYAGEGPDLTGKLEREAERQRNFLEDDEWSEGRTDLEIDIEAWRRAREALAVQHGGMVMRVFVRLDNPVVLGGPNETTLSYEESYDEATDEYGEPTGTLVDFVEALQNAAGRKYDADNVGDGIAALYEEAANAGGISAEKVWSMLKAPDYLGYATDDNGDNATNEIIRAAFEGAGFDGVIDQTVNKKFGSEKRVGKAMAGMHQGTVHYVAFRPEQIKSAISNTGEFSNENPGILFAEAAGPRRGSFNPLTFDLRLLADANRSTFIHEASHFFMAAYIDMASQPDAPPQLKEFVENLLGYLFEKVLGGAQVGGEGLGQPAYHGSPYKFDKFSLEHLGKGEGARAYGWGLYFAGEKGVAEHYRQVLSSKYPISHYGVIEENGEFIAWAKHAEQDNVKEIARSSTKAGAQKALKKHLEGNRGVTYEVDIPEEGSYLLWDKPLSEQPEAVKAALANDPSWKFAKTVAGKAGKAGDDGRFVYKDISDRLGDDEAASKHLNSLGIAGIKYLDGTSRDKGEGSFNYVIFDASAVRILQTLYQEVGAGGTAPGPIPGGRTNLERWNAMTLDQQRAYWEFFAEGWEQYAMTGKAPTKALQSAFNAFAKWMKEIYKTLKNFVTMHGTKPLDAELTQYFDRMLATDEELEAARAERGFQALFKNLAESGMAPAQFADYMALDALQKTEAEELLRSRSIRDMKWLSNAKSRAIKEIQAEADELRNLVRAGVEEELANTPIRQAERWLRKGEMVQDGEQIKATAGFKLNTEILKAMFPEGAVAGQIDFAKLGRGANALASTTGTQHPDDVAQIFGFRSGEQLVRELVEMPAFKDEVAHLTDLQMLEEHGDLATPQAIEKAADEAIHNDAHLRMVATEVWALTNRTGSVAMLTKAAKAFASNLVDNTVVKKLSPVQFVNAATRAGKAAVRALAKKDTNKAASEKRVEMVNAAAAKEAYAAEAEVRAIMTRLRKITAYSDKHSSVTSREMGVVQAVRAILAEFDIGTHGEKATKYLKTLSEYDPTLGAVLDDTIETLAPEAKPWQSLKVAELRELHASVTGLWRIAKEVRSVELAGEKMSLDDARAQLVAKLEESQKAGRVSKAFSLTDAEIRNQDFQSYTAKAVRPESWISMKDGLDEYGPWRRLIWNTIDRAQLDYNAEKAEKLKQLKALLVPIMADMTDIQIDAPELGGSFGAGSVIGYSELLHAILHTGNTSNKTKLLVGRGWGALREDGTLDSSKWDAFLARVYREGKITKTHMDFVQGVWDLLESMKEGAQKAHRTATGRYFEEIDPAEIVTPFGAYRGGYAPAIVDRRQVADMDVRKLQEAAEMDVIHSFEKPAGGFTKSRVQNYNQKLELNIAALGRHIDQVLLFAHMSVPVRNVQRVLKGKDLSSTLAEQDRAAIAHVLAPWLHSAATQIVTERGKLSYENLPIFSKARTRAGAALMFLNVSNSIQQLTGFFPAALKVSKKEMLFAAAKAWYKPREMAASVAAMSPYMSQRLDNEVHAMAEEIDQILLNPTRYEKAQDWALAHSYFLQTAVDSVMSPIIWQAKFNEAMSRGAEQQEAIDLADSAVRMTQGSNRAIDIAAMEKGSPFYRMFMQFAGYFNTQINLVGEKLAREKLLPTTPAKYGRIAMVLAQGWWAPAIASMLVAVLFRGGPDDKDGDGLWDEWLAELLLSPVKYATAAVPVFGQTINAAFNAFNDKPFDDRISMSPAVSLVEASFKGIAGVKGAIEDPAKRGRVIRDLGTFLSLFTGIPVTPATKAAGYATDVATGKVSPTGAVDAARGTITGVASPESKQ